MPGFIDNAHAALTGFVAGALAKLALEQPILQEVERLPATPEVHVIFNGEHYMIRVVKV